MYGELSVPTLATILDAVGVRTEGEEGGGEGERFLDVGSGDGGLVLAASLLYAGGGEGGGGGSNPIRRATGVEIVPELVGRSRRHAARLAEELELELELEAELELEDPEELLRRRRGSSVSALTLTASTRTRAKRAVRYFMISAKEKMEAIRERKRKWMRSRPIMD